MCAAHNKKNTFPVLYVALMHVFQLFAVGFLWVPLLAWVTQTMLQYTCQCHHRHITAGFSSCSCYQPEELIQLWSVLDIIPNHLSHVRRLWTGMGSFRQLSGIKPLLKVCKSNCIGVLDADWEGGSYGHLIPQQSCVCNFKTQDLGLGGTWWQILKIWITVSWQTSGVLPAIASVFLHWKLGGGGGGLFFFLMCLVCVSCND